MSIEYKDLKHENIILYNRIKKHIDRGYIENKEKKQLYRDIMSYYTHYQQFIEVFENSYTAGETIRKMRKEFKNIGQLTQKYTVLEWI